MFHEKVSGEEGAPCRAEDSEHIHVHVLPGCDRGGPGWSNPRRWEEEEVLEEASKTHRHKGIGLGEVVQGESRHGKLWRRQRKRKPGRKRCEWVFEDARKSFVVVGTLGPRQSPADFCGDIGKVGAFWSGVDWILLTLLLVKTISVTVNMK